MKLQHFIGGLQNLGPVNTDTRVFAAPWERRIFGIHTAMMALSTHLSGALPKYRLAEVPTRFRHVWTWASLRTGAEGMQPFEYFKYRYYEKWLMGISGFFIDQGYLSNAELAARTAHYAANPAAPLPQRPNPRLAEQVDDYLQQGDSAYHAAAAPRFAAGSRVCVANPPEAAHTRLPGYLRGKTGVVDCAYPGAYAYFVSTGADGIGAAMPVYRVAFAGENLWSEGMYEAGTTVYADLFEAYLHPAP